MQEDLSHWLTPLEPISVRPKDPNDVIVGQIVRCWPADFAGSDHSFPGDGSPSLDSPNLGVPADHLALGIVGMPSDAAVLGRPGAAEGPRAIREALWQCTPFDWEEEIDLAEHFHLIDFGDIAVHPSDVDETHRRGLAALVPLFRTGLPLCILGGDHSNTYVTVRALAEALEQGVDGLRPSPEGVPESGPDPRRGAGRSSSGVLGRSAAMGPTSPTPDGTAPADPAAAAPPRLGLITLDAHHDLREPGAAPGPVHNSGTPFRRILDLPRQPVRAGNLVQIGIASWRNSRHYADYTRQEGVRVVTVRETHRRGIGPVVEEALEIATRDSNGFFLSFDLDVLDVPFAPGVSAHSPGGLTTYQALEAVRQIARHPACLGMDIMEGAPALDQGNRTARLAAQLVLEFAAGVKGR